MESSAHRCDWLHVVRLMVSMRGVRACPVIARCDRVKVCARCDLVCVQVVMGGQWLMLRCLSLSFRVGALAIPDCCVTYLTERKCVKIASAPPTSHCDPPTLTMGMDKIGLAPYEVF